MSTMVLCLYYSALDNEKWPKVKIVKKLIIISWKPFCEKTN